MSSRKECRPPAREPARSWLARRSTMATSTPANANSPANISPVGPPPAITTACSVIAALRPASCRPPPAHHIPRPPRRPTRPRAGAGPPPTAASPRSPAGAPAGRSAPAARRHGPAAPRSPAARTPTPPRRVPATAPRVPPSVRRPRATHTSTTTHASRYPDFRRFWLRPALCGTTQGLPQAPRCAIYWKWKGVGTLLSTYRPPWTDNLLAKRRRAAYGGTVSPGGSPVGGELVLRQDCLEPQLGAGATLCWIVTLSIAQRGEFEDTFEDPQIDGKWLVGGSHIVLPNPWLPPT